MNRTQSNEAVRRLVRAQERLLKRKNRAAGGGNGIVRRFTYPVVTAEHVPVSWRYDLDTRTNPHLLERIGVNAAFNPGAIEHNGKILLVVRVEGADRKSFFAVAESSNGIDNSGSGSIRSGCRKRRIRTSTYTICVW